MKRMRLGRKNEKLVRDYRLIIAERDRALMEARIANSTIDGLMTDLAGATLVAVSTRTSSSYFGGDTVKIRTISARLKQLTPHGRLLNLGEPVCAEMHVDARLGDDPCRIWANLGAQVLEKIVENDLNMH